MLKLSRRFFIVLLIGTIVWAALFWISIEEYAIYYEAKRNLPYQAWNGGLFFLIIGFMLFSTWAIAGVVKRNIQIGIALTGIVIAFAFFVAAQTENIGYSLEPIFTGDGGYYIVSLNPFLHLGGGRVKGVAGLSFYARLSSMSMRNLILYLVYGESISFSLMGIFLLTNKYLLKKHRFLKEE
jgi:hypothetical protein